MDDHGKKEAEAHLNSVIEASIKEHKENLLGGKVKKMVKCM